jgi:hypothetical protein
MEGKEMPSSLARSIVNHYEAGSNCQVFNGNISGCVFAMPGATVTQQPPPPPSKPPVAEGEIPEVLAASKQWQQVIQAGLVNANGQPTVSRPEAALIADMLAEVLGITNKWKFYEQLWQRNNMRGDYNTALDQRKSLKFQERLKIILG